MLKLTFFSIILAGLFACSKSSTPESIFAEVHQGYSEKEAAECLSINVTHDDIKTVIAQSVVIRGEKWHYEHISPPCHFTGRINHEGVDRVFRYYPTGYISLEGYEGWFMCYECTVNSNWVSFDRH